VIDIGGTHIKVTAYQGICRFVYFLPFSAVCWLAGPIITPSLIMSTTFMGFIEFRKKILFALHAAKIRARAACIRGSRSVLGPRTPSDRLMSRDPIRQRRFPPAETLEEFMPALVRKDCAGSVLGLQREAT